MDLIILLIIIYFIWKYRYGILSFFEGVKRFFGTIARLICSIKPPDISKFSSSSGAASESEGNSKTTPDSKTEEKKKVPKPVSDCYEDNDYTGWKPKEYQNYIADLENKANSGNNVAIYSLISIYKSGIKDIVPANMAMSAKYMRMAADGGDVKMAYQYAMLLETTDPCYQMYMKDAADSYIPAAMYEMYMLWKKRSNLSQRREAKVYLAGAADQKYPEALEEIKYIARNSGRTEAEINRLIDEFLCRGSFGSGHKRTPGDDTLTDAEISNLNNYHLERVKNGQVASMIWLSKLYEQGQLGVTIDHSLAKKYKQMAIDHGYNE